MSSSAVLTPAAQAAPAATFAELGVPAPLVESLAADGFTTAFPIQSDTLPDTLAGRDVLGRGRTGSGKTLAFALPMVSRLAATAPERRRAGRPRGLVLAPTRELANQIEATIEPLGRAMGLTVTTVFGGVSQHRQEVALGRGVDIVVACPGRLEDLMGQRIVTLADIAVTVIDEADLMADLGFLPAVKRILAATPADGQRMLFSATLDHGIDQLAKRFLHSPLFHSVDEATSPVATMTHHVFEVRDADAKKGLIRALAAGRTRRILFTRTKHVAKRLAKQLTAAGIPAVDLQGNLSQNARESHLAAFSDGSVKVMVATDIAARGIDIDDVELVVHVDPPAEHKAYLHRSGRTARAGATGDVVTIVLPEQRNDVRQLMRKAKITARPEQVTADSPAVTELVGEPAEYVAPAREPVQQQGTPRRSGSAGRSGRRGQGRGQGGRGQGGRGQSGRGQDGRSQGGRGRDDSRGRGRGRGADREQPVGAGRSGSRRRSSRGDRESSFSAPSVDRASRYAPGRGSRIWSTSTPTDGSSSRRGR